MNLSKFSSGFVKHVIFLDKRKIKRRYYYTISISIIVQYSIVLVVVFILRLRNNPKLCNSLSAMQLREVLEKKVSQNTLNKE